MNKIKVNGKEYTEKQFEEDIVKDVFSWLQEHPVVTNKDLLEKLFGNDQFSCVRKPLTTSVVRGGITYSITLNQRSARKTGWSKNTDIRKENKKNG